MGWRDINLNRRKPQRDVAVIPVAAGEDRDSAVLRKAVAAALACAAAQDATADRFAAGYVAGYARQQGLKHGLDAERDCGAALIARIRAQAPADWQEALRGLSLAPRQRPSSRAALGFAERLADAGYLVGHLEALCGTRRLLARPATAAAYLTLCDHAADRLQTHQPTAVLRLDPVERAIVEAAFASPD